MESILTILLGGVLLAAALLGGALAVPHPWGIVPTAVVIRSCITKRRQTAA